MVRLDGKVCLVTGASRGIGRGIALQLAEAGAIVYITGRTLNRTDGLPGSLSDTANEITSRGNGTCIPVQCDHSKEEDVAKVFERIGSEQNGRLDVLVNNAYSAVMAIAKYRKIPYWEQPISMWDESNNVGLRNHYVCAVHAAKMMVPRRQGLIVNVSSMGGLTYALNVAYGIGKAGCDRMAADCAVELRQHNVAFVSLWPGAVLTELMDEYTESPEGADKLEGLFSDKSACETPEFAGIAVAHLAADPNVIKKTGRILLTGDLSDEYGFVDVNGRRPESFRSFSFLLSRNRHSTLASICPRWMKMPRWMLSLAGNKL